MDISPFLFTGSVHDNIRYNKADATRQPVHAPETCERVRVSLQVRLLTE